MARFSQGFLSNLGRPAMTQSLFDLGTAIGNLPQQRQAQKIRQANAAELSGVKEGSSEWYAIASRQAANAGDIETARQYAEMARESKMQERRASAATLATSGELQNMRASVKEYAAMGDLESATNLQNSIKDIESKKGVEALRAYTNAPGINLADPNAKEGFFAIARAYGVSDPDKMIKDALAPKVSVKDQAELVIEGFSPSNVERYAQTGQIVDLGGRSEEKKNNLTEFQKTVIASGVEQGSDEYMRLMRARSEMMSESGTELDRVSQMQTLSGSLQRDPVYKQNSKIVSDSSKVISTIDSIKLRMASGDPVSELNRVLERSASELFNSDSRAATEINRFMKDKGIARSLSDLFSALVAGELSKDTLDAIKAVAEQAQASSTAEANKKVDQFYSLYQGVADASVLESIKSNMRVGSALPADGVPPNMEVLTPYPKNPPKELTLKLWENMTADEKATFKEVDQ